MRLDAEARSRLATLAAAATPGPWNGDVRTTYQDGEPLRSVIVGEEVGIAVMDADLSESQRNRNARYVAAASPDVVVGLLADLTAAEARAEAAERERDEARMESILKRLRAEAAEQRAETLAAAIGLLRLARMSCTTKLPNTADAIAAFLADYDAALADRERTP